MMECSNTSPDWTQNMHDVLQCVVIHVQVKFPNSLPNNT